MPNESQTPLTDRYPATVRTADPEPLPTPPSTAEARAGVDTARDRRDPKAVAGTELLGFYLLEEIGRGAFSRVYLARQGELSDRHVVLKVSADADRESSALARLQHTNIVPIHSVHRGGGKHVVCMPYLGTATLVDVYNELDGMPSLPHSGRDLFTTLNTRRQATDHPGLMAEASGRLPAHQPVLATLAGRSFVDAVLWLGARLADGLEHAHARGVIHRDLKPANVLLTDDGQPMLLDFNLSAVAAADAAARGGTPPYMAPEQLETFAGTPRPVDARSDLFSLGVMLYELLTRRSPFPRRKANGPDVWQAMITDRQGTPPRLRRWNKAVSPAAEAIVRRCLEPDPARRYQSAAHLREDIDRHLADRSLAHTPEPSLRERVRKWRRRNRLFTSTASAAAVLTVTAAVLTVGYLTWGARLDMLEAADTYRAFATEAEAAQVRLLDRSADRERLDDGIRLCVIALNRYGATDRADWLTGPKAAHLPDADRDRLRGQAGELLVLLSRAVAKRAVMDAGGADPKPELVRALSLADAARGCFPADAEPRTVREQRAYLARLLNYPTDPTAPAAPASEQPLDRFLQAHDLAARGEYRRALPLLKAITRDDPREYVGWFVQGVCHLELMQDAEAAGCFNCCVALRPDDHWAWYNRGLAARRRRDFEQARADFDRVVSLRPEQASAYLHRGLVRHELREYAGAVEDLTKALDLGGPATSLLFRRAAAKKAAGDATGAAEDRAEAVRRTPTDEDGFVERGLARVRKDPTGALADFDAALKLNPQSFRGLQNKAALLSDQFKKDAEALTVLDQAVRLYPDSVLARAGRGVLLARAGQAERAEADAKAALELDSSPATQYQVGCVYALLSATQPTHRAKAFQLVSAAVRQGYGHEYLESDADLKPLRPHAEFEQLTTAARALRAKPAGGR